MPNVGAPVGRNWVLQGPTTLPGLPPSHVARFVYRTTTLSTRTCRAQQKRDSTATSSPLAKAACVMRCAGGCCDARREASTTPPAAPETAPRLLGISPRASAMHSALPSHPSTATASGGARFAPAMQSRSRANIPHAQISPSPLRNAQLRNAAGQAPARAARVPRWPGHLWIVCCARLCW